MPWTIPSSVEPFIQAPASCPSAMVRPLTAERVSQCGTCRAVLVSTDPPPGEVYILKLIPSELTATLYRSDTAAESRSVGVSADKRTASWRRFTARSTSKRTATSRPSPSRTGPEVTGRMSRSAHTADTDQTDHAGPSS